MLLPSYRFTKSDTTWPIWAAGYILELFLLICTHLNNTLIYVIELQLIIFASYEFFKALWEHP